MIEIPLTRGQVAIVDDEDADLAELTWNASCCDGKYYAAHKTPMVRRRPGRTELLHRLILARALGRELKKGELCDHIDRNPLNNTRSNLRVASFSENSRNRAATKRNTSGYKGVSWHKGCKRWQAGIHINGKFFFLGNFDTRAEAARAYDTAAKELFGEFAALNIDLVQEEVL